MVELRITKYDPRNRNEYGHYLLDEWTEVEDVEEGKVSIDRYLQIEDAYVLSVRMMMNLAGISQVMIVYLEDSGDRNTVPGYDGVVLPSPPQIGQIVRGTTLDLIVRMSLRDDIFCMLEGLNGFYLHVGGEFYMFSGFEGELPSGFAPPEGVFWEPFVSPHSIDEFLESLQEDMDLPSPLVLYEQSDLLALSLLQRFLQMVDDQVVRIEAVNFQKLQQLIAHQMYAQAIIRMCKEINALELEINEYFHDLTVRYCRANCIEEKYWGSLRERIARP